MSTTSPVEIQTCEGRPRYETYTEADRQAWYTMARRRHFDEDFMLAAHFCPQCGGWHVGNPRKDAAVGRWSPTLA